MWSGPEGGRGSTSKWCCMATGHSLLTDSSGFRWVEQFQDLALWVLPGAPSSLWEKHCSILTCYSAHSLSWPVAVATWRPISQFFISWNEQSWLFRDNNGDQSSVSAVSLPPLTFRPSTALSSFLSSLPDNLLVPWIPYSALGSYDQDTILSSCTNCRGRWASWLFQHRSITREPEYSFGLLWLGDWRLRSRLAFLSLEGNSNLKWREELSSHWTFLSAN